MSGEDVRLSFNASVFQHEKKLLYSIILWFLPALKIILYLCSQIFST